jgi:lipid II:glycine glycyltransferase (peptidoglycan interpeptide bridge formation enzyme)
MIQEIFCIKETGVEQSSEKLSYEVERVTESEWTNVVLRFRDASLYQTFQYGTVRWGRSNLSHILIKRDGDIVAAAQLSLMMVPGIKRGIAYVPWGPMWRSNNESDQLDIFRQTIRILLSEYAIKRQLLVRVDPNVTRDEIPNLGAILEEEGFKIYHFKPAHNTIIIDLSPPLNELLMGLKRKWRENLRSAQRKGLKLVEGVEDELWKIFTDLYREMHARKKFSKSVSVEQFREVQKVLPKELKMRVVLAYFESEPVASLIWSRIGDKSVPIFSATSIKGRSLGGAYLLRWNMLEQSKLLGCRYMDQGGVSAEHNPGGYSFKMGMGGRETKHVGSYYACHSLISYLIITASERLRSLRG